MSDDGPAGRESLRGELSAFFPAEILQLLQLAQATGRLELQREGERVNLFIERGRPVFARTNATRVRTGEMLVHLGAVSPEAVELALALQADMPGRRLGELLVEGGATARADLEHAVREVAKRIVYGALLWREGTFRFVPGAVDGEDVKLDLELDRMILEGLRQADESRR